MQWGNLWLRLGRFPEGLVRQIEVPAGQPRPRYSVASKVSLEPVELKGCPVENAVVGIDLGHQGQLDGFPILPQETKRFRVDRNACRLHARDGGHVTPPQQRTG